MTDRAFASRPRAVLADGRRGGSGSPLSDRLNTGLAATRLAALSDRLNAPGRRGSAIGHGFGDGVAQRSVLTRYDKNNVLVYFSDLEEGKKGVGVTTYPTHAEAKIADEALLATDGVLAHALTTDEKTPRERRTPTPFGYAKAKATAKVRHQDQKPHSVAFISVEQRLQNRLAKNQHDEIRQQFPTNEQAEAGMIAEHGLTKGSQKLNRYLADLNSLRDEYDHRLANDASKGVGSALHLVARKLLNMHPYASYAKGTSARQQEGRHELFGSSVIDSTHKMKNEGKFEEFLQDRADLYHSSDDEASGYDKTSKSKPHVFTTLTPRERRFSRAKRAAAASTSSSSTTSSPPSLSLTASLGTAGEGESKKRKASETETKREKEEETVTLAGASDSVGSASAKAQPLVKKYRDKTGGAIDASAIVKGEKTSGTGDVEMFDPFASGTHEK